MEGTVVIATEKQSGMTVDLNCDMGESFGVYSRGCDEEIMPYVTSANIACGFHAGDPATMRRTVRLALEHGVAIGAHPGLPDLAGFGRRNMDVSPDEAYGLVMYQTGALMAFVRAEGGRLRHVKAHGALYNMAARSRELAEAIAEAVYRIDPELFLFGPASSELIKAGQRIGLRTVSEAFADRSYERDGSLTPRRLPEALIDDEEEASRRAVRMVREGRVRSRQGEDVVIVAETICIHGDGPHALPFARSIRQALEREGIAVRPAGASR
jgi:UPF0271 protein